MISLVVLASGFGKRFGANKLLYEINGKAMYRHILDKLYELSHNEKNGDCFRIIVVTQYEEIVSYCDNMGIESLYNEQAFEGIAASVRKGAEAAADCEWIFYFTGDQPYLTRDTVEGFINDTIKSGLTLASVRSVNGPGNPSGFNKKWREALMSLSGDAGGRKILNNHLDEIFWYEVPYKELKDIDFLDEGGRN